MKTQLLQWSYGRGKRDFSRIQLPNVDLSKVKLKFICLSQANLQGANLSQGQFAGADFVYAHLEDANLSGANFIGANFLAANLQRANLSRAMLCGSLLSVTDLSYACLEQATLAGADLRSANLTGANLSHANLQGANLTAANLTQANLTGADLTGAILTGTLLPDATAPEPKPQPLSLIAPVFNTLMPPQDKKSLRSRRTKVKGQGLQTNFSDVIVYKAVPKTDGDLARAADNRALEFGWSEEVSGDLQAGTASNTHGKVRDSSLLFLHQDLGSYFQSENPTDAQVRLQRSILLRKGHYPLRKKLLLAYDERCAISRCSVHQVLEVAYILPFCGKLTNDPSNVLLLRSDLHLLFDLHLIAIDPNTLTVRLAPWLQDSYYSNLEGRSLYLPLNPDLCPSPEALAEHQNLCEWEVNEAWTNAYAL